MPILKPFIKPIVKEFSSFNFLPFIPPLDMSQAYVHPSAPSSCVMSPLHMTVPKNWCVCCVLERSSVCMSPFLFSSAVSNVQSFVQCWPQICHCALATRRLLSEYQKCKRQIQLTEWDEKHSRALWDGAQMHISYWDYSIRTKGIRNIGPFQIWGNCDKDNKSLNITVFFVPCHSLAGGIRFFFFFSSLSVIHFYLSVSRTTKQTPGKGYTSRFFFPQIKKKGKSRHFMHNLMTFNTRSEFLKHYIISKDKLLVGLN